MRRRPKDFPYGKICCCAAALFPLTVRARVDLIVVAPRKNVFFHNSPKVVVGHGLKDYGVKNLFTM